MISLELRELGGGNSPKSRALFGTLGNISLGDLVHLMAVNNQTAILAFNRGGEKGKIFFKDGRARHAFVGNLEGEEAILDLLEWTDADFAVEDGSAFLNKITINKNAEALMLSLCTRLDEMRRDRGRANSRGEGRARESRMRRTSSTLARSVPAGVGSSDRKRPIIATLTAIGLATLSLLLAFGWISSQDKASAEKASVSRSSLSPMIPSRSLDAETVAPQPPNSPDSEPPAEPLARPETVEQPRPLPAPEPTAPGHLVAVVEPWADVWIDGQKRGMTPLGKIELSVGDHTIELSNPHFVGVIADRITIPSRGTLAKKYSFHDAGYLQLVVFPWAEVYIDGKHIGQTPMAKTKVPVGMHDITLRHPELGEKHTEASIKLEETTVIRLDM